MGTQRLDGKTVIVTGASAGVGAAAARKFVELGATVAVVGRSEQKTNAVAEAIKAKPYLADFARLDDVRKLAERLLADFPAIDILANNAGLRAAKRVLTVDGHETTFQVDYLAPFLLTHLLRARLAEAEDARVISTASGAHAFGKLDLDDLESAKSYKSFRVYGTWKLGNILFTRELARRAKGTSITASSFHPGGIASDFFRDNAFLAGMLRTPVGKILKTPDQGAEPLLHLATVADPQSVNGAYFNLLKRSEPKVPSDAVARELWDRTAKLLNVDQ